MIKNKQLKLIILTCATVLVGSVVLYFYLPPAATRRQAVALPNSTGTQTQATDTSSNSNQDQGSRLPAVPAPPSQPPDRAATTLVHFNSTSDQQAYTRINQLEPSELNYLASLDVFRINRPNGSLISTTGTTTYPNIRYTALSTPNDPSYASQWYAGKTNQPQAWELTTGSSAITTAVIDTGFALNHIDFSGRWATNGSETGTTVAQGPAPNCTSRSLTLDKSCNNLDDDGNGLVDDWRGWDFANGDNSTQAGATNPYASSLGHGSLVAGLIGASGNNATAIAGANWNTKLLPLQALDDNGVGYTDTVAAGVHYATDRGAKIINLSLGADSEDILLKNEIDRAINAGVIVVAAAGNSNCNCMLYPANYPSVIAVGASDSNDNRAAFSSYGANLDFLAPGMNICSLDWSLANQTTLTSCGHAGTSFAAPIVSGTVSLMLARAPSLLASDVERLLAHSSTDAASYSMYSGYGRLDAYQAVLAASLDTPSGLIINKHVTFLSNNSSLSLGPLMSSSCQTLPAASCEIRLTGPTNQVVSIGTKPVDEAGTATFYWNAATLGLATGRWRVDAIATYNGQTTTQTDYVTVNP